MAWTLSVLRSSSSQWPAGGMNVKSLGIILTTFLAATLNAGRTLAADVDIAIVFAVDVSGSIDRNTADLQREGHAMAIRSPEFITAIAGKVQLCRGFPGS